MAASSPSRIAFSTCETAVTAVDNAVEARSAQNRPNCSSASALSTALNAPSKATRARSATSSSPVSFQTLESASAINSFLLPCDESSTHVCPTMIEQEQESR